MNIIITGAPGSGKGTQADNIKEYFGIAHVSTGDAFRALDKESELGKKVNSYMSTGALVPDDIVVDVLFNRIEQDDCKNGVLLDGYPRTIPQAEALAKRDFVIDAVVVMDVDDDTIMTRLTSRTFCPKCSSTYGAEKPEGAICGKNGCDAKVIVRKDDMPETVANRLKTYHEQTEPIIDYYKDKAKMLKIYVGPEETKEETTKRVREAISKL